MSSVLQTVLQAEDIAIAYQSGHTVLADFRLTLQAGEIVAVLGPSGAGKSSLLRVLAGLQKPVQGNISVLGQPTQQSAHPRVALAFQDPGLLPWLSVGNNVAFGLDFSRQTKLSKEERQQRVQAAIHDVGLEHASHYYPSALSGGMAQRTALARCLARQPEVLLLDEPFGALDEVTRHDMQQLLSQVVHTHRTATVLVTHDIDEALLLADRILLLGGTPARIVGQWSLAQARPRDALLTELGLLRIEILKTLRQAGRAASPVTNPANTETAHVS